MLTVADLNHKNVVLCGREKAVKWFFQKYNQLNVTGTIIFEKEETEFFPNFSNYGPETDCIPPHLIREIDIIKEKQTNTLYVICQKHAHHNKIADMMNFNGYVLGNDYVYSWEIETLLSTKKVVALGGYYCYVYDLLILFNEHPYTKENCLVFPFIWHENLNLHYDVSINRFLKICDYYIFNADSNANCRFGETELPTNCKTISFPCINFRAFFPQCADQNSNESNNPYFLKLPSGKSSGYKYRDCWLENLYESGKSVNEIIDLVTDSNFMDPATIISNFNKELRISHYYERKCDVKLVEFIKANYRKFRLLNTSGHWDIHLAYECFRQILSIMFVGMVTDDETKDKLLTSGRKYTQIPIYPTVVKALNLDWYKTDQQNGIKLVNGWKEINFEEYVDTYLKYIQSSKRILYFSKLRSKVKKPFIVAVDGNSCSGKSFVSRTIAQKYEMEYLNTGNLYRAATAYYLNNQNIDDLVRAMQTCRIERNGNIVINDCCYTDEMLGCEIIEENVAVVSQNPLIRETITLIIRNYCINKAIVVDGRDIGTVVFPNADLKFFFVASIEARAKAWIAKSADNPDVYQKIERIRKRDYEDRNRRVSPLLQAEDAIFINRDNVTIDDAIINISLKIDEKISQKGDYL